MNIRRKLLAVTTVGFLAGGALAGCSSGSASTDTTGSDAGSSSGSESGEKAEVTEKDSYVIGVAVPNQEAPFFNGVRQAVESEAKGMASPKVEVVVVDAKDNADSQVSQMQDLITRGVDAIIYIPAGATAAAVPVRAAHEVGIPIISVDRNPADEPGDTFIATDSEGAAEELGKWVVEQTGGKGDLGVIQGQVGTTPEETRATGFDRALNDTEITLVAQQASEAWHRDEGFNIAQDMLQANPQINIIFGRADALALGAAQAARALNRDDILIVGFDGDPEGIEGVRDGTIDATMTQQTNLMGKLALESAIKLVNGETLPQEQLQTAVLTTKDNAQELLDQHP